MQRDAYTSPSVWLRLMNRETSMRPIIPRISANPRFRVYHAQKNSAEEPGHRVPDDGLALLEAHARGVLGHLKHVHHL